MRLTLRRPADVFDEFGVNVRASDLLDAHHEIVGVSEFGDEIVDWCELCGFAAGWVQSTRLGPDHHGHATARSTATVRWWIRHNKNRKDAH